MKIKKIFCLFLIVMSGLIILTGCKDQDGDGDKIDDTIDNLTDPVKKATSYGITHKDYIGFATVTKANGVAIHISIDEAFLPMVWAQETNAGALTEIVNDASGSPLKTTTGFGYAKYIKIGDKVFTGVGYTEAEKENLDSTKQLIKYSSDGISDLYAHLKTESNAKWYVEKLKTGEAYVCDAEGKKLTVTDVNPQGTFFKSSSLYWTTGTNGWAKNIQFLAHAMVGTALTEEATMVDGYVKIGDVTTSATIADYSDYYNLVKKAFEKIA